MKVLVLDSRPVECAHAHCDSDILRCGPQLAEILATAARLNNRGTGGSTSSWVIKSAEVQWATHPINWMWLYKLALEVAAETRRRFGAESSVLSDLLHLPSELRIASQYIKRDPLVWVFPDGMGSTKGTEECVTAWREFYVRTRGPKARWTHRPVPVWFVDAVRAQPEGDLLESAGMQQSLGVAE